MKKLLDSKFLFIVALSLVVLIILGVGAFYLFNDNDDTFTRSGYVLNPLSPKVEKYFFDENTGYHENLSQMIEFKDVDDKDVTIFKESFLHYMDGSMSFLKNGAILDLNSINGEKAVNFYNITNKSIIEKKGNDYLIKTNGNDIKLKNFVGRINDDKYIVVGTLEAKIPGNNANVKADYFEIVYTEEGVVNIENKDAKYQVTAQGTYIYAGNIVIDLGNKKITSNGKDVMSITAITIDGDENIEIIPAEEEKEGGGGDGNGNNPDNQNPNPNDNSGGDSSGDGNGGTGEEGDKEALTASLKEASVGSTNIDVSFDIANAKEDDSFTLKVTNLSTGRTVDMFENVKNDESIKVNLLSPATKYLFTLINERDGSKYFQKIFETKDFGISLEKNYTTANAISYKVTVGEDTDITNAKLSLYKFNEETNKNEIVKTTYFDAETGEEKSIEKVVNLASLDGNIKGTHEIVFDSLDSNTIYTAVLDEFSFASSNFKDIYNITLTSLTLKQTPSFGNMTADKDVNASGFKLALSDIVDPDNAITNYTYLIYESSDRTKTAIPPISKNNASAIEVKVGNADNQLKNDTNYYYNVVIEYFDNEKYIEYVTGDSINFVMGTEPYVTVVPDNSKISFDSIGATIYLIDNSCLITMPGREKCDGDSATIVDVSRINIITGERTSVFTRVVDFTVDDDQIKYNLFLDNLQAGTAYTIDVRSVRSDMPSSELVEIVHTDDSKRSITTKSLASFLAEWTDQESSANHVVNVKSKLIGEDGSGTMPPDETAAAIKKVVLKLYEGDYADDLQAREPLATKVFTNSDEFNIKENFYDNGYDVTSDGTFGLDIDGLKAANEEGKLSEYYTITIEGYYDSNANGGVRISNNTTVYRISPVLLMENVDDPRIFIDNILNGNSAVNNNLLNSGTVVGYKVTAAFDRNGLLENHLTAQKINLYVYNQAGQKVNFYVLNNGTLKLTDKISANLGDSNNYEADIYMANGSEYHVVDTSMTRGNKYYIGYELELTSSKGTEKYPNNTNTNVHANYGLYSAVISQKETPSLKMHIAKSTADSITYRYDLVDPDNALYRTDANADYYFYYVVNDGEEHGLKLIKTDDNINKFAGDATINGLNNNDVYQLYYKKNVTKTGDIEADVLNYYDGSDDGKHLFDGYYDALSEEYNFKYELINNSLYDNKVTIKILASDSILSRILGYKVAFVDQKNNKLTRDYWKLSSCGADQEDRCLSVDYIDLKNAGMKSNNDEINAIKVTVTAFYDNGLMGYDYTVGEGKDYRYMIMQDNNTGTKYGDYLSFNSRGQLINWIDTVPKGYYTYVYNANDSTIAYTSAINSNYKDFGCTLTSNGFVANLGALRPVLNPKMVSVNNMSSDNDTFSFSSITPKISVDSTVKLINGAYITLSLSGADIGDFCGETSGNNCQNNADKYIYLDVWENMEDVGDFTKKVRPTVKTKIENISDSLNAVVDKLNNNKAYYYQIYAYLNKSGRSVYTQLFDAGYTDRYETKTYNFTTLKSTDIIDASSLRIDYKSKPEGNYGEKLLDTMFNLRSYQNAVSFNYDINYVFCLPSDDLGDENCNIDINEEDPNILFKSTIDMNDLIANVTDSKDISSLDLEFDKNYVLNIYATFDVYDVENDRIIKKNLWLNPRDNVVRLGKLTAPEFLVGREAVYENGEYAIDFIINVNDKDEVLMGGNYHIKLLSSGNNLVGSLRVSDGDGGWAAYTECTDPDDYSTCVFDARIINKRIRITGLQENKDYTVLVWGEADINNYSESIPRDERRIIIEKSHTVYSTNESGVAFGKPLFSATEKSIVVTFLGGSSFDNVKAVDYTIGLWDDEESAFTNGGTYILSSTGKRFELYENSDDWRFVINPDWMTNVLGKTYKVVLQFYVPNINESDIQINNETDIENNIDKFIIYRFESEVQYVKDKN